MFKFNHTNAGYVNLKFKKAGLTVPATANLEEIVQITSLESGGGFEIDIKLPDGCNKLLDMYYLVGLTPVRIEGHPPRAEKFVVEIGAGVKPKKPRTPKAPRKAARKASK